MLNRVGETAVSNIGLMMTIVEYHNANNIDIKFEDGVIVKHKAYSAFIKGAIGHPNIPNINRVHQHKTKQEYIGEVKYNSLRNMNMTIIDYVTYNDITVRFDDGVIVEHIGYERFKAGRIKVPLNHIGIKVHSKSWGTIECIGFRSCKDFDLKFLDYDNIIRQHCSSWSNFMQGLVSPQYKLYKSGVSPFAINDTAISTYSGQKMTIIDIDPVSKKYKVQFEDGYISDWHKSISDFRKGLIYNPNTHKSKFEDKYLGKVITHKNGMKMTVISINPVHPKHKHRTLNVQFEDGYIKKDVSPNNFLKGVVSHPAFHYKTLKARKKIDTMQTKNKSTGLSMRVIEYVDAHNVTVQFETGYKVEHKGISDFYGGKIKHKFPYTIGVLTMEKPAYVYNGEGNFYCKCKKCGLSDVMNLTEIREHICIDKPKK